MGAVVVVGAVVGGVGVGRWTNLDCKVEDISTKPENLRKRRKCISFVFLTQQTFLNTTSLNVFESKH